MTTPALGLLDQYEEYLRNRKYPGLDSWPLMRDTGPWPIISILSAYLLFVLKIGPQFMANRKPYNLQPLIVVYNLFLVLFSGFLSIWPFFNGVATWYINDCHPKEKQPIRIFYLATVFGYLFFLSKIVELADTVFFVLRKKDSQISFLHLYHHTLTLIYSWVHMNYIPGAQGVIVAYLNSVAHVFMYTYYMLSAMGPRLRKYLWWKKYITWIQLIQFCLMLSYMIGSLAFDCDQPKGLSIYFIFISGVFLCLFSNFYRKTYTKKIKK
ncbi:very long chain fatty acid elongase 7-like [Periplaneta americana]|uniref:very long chain fatty acid elongase 7-like n=1 Tax=Periplaneta americana TaxID=6978 RepID=UPI0037E7F2E0